MIAMASRFLLFLALATAACIGDRFWILRTTAEFPRPVANDCVRTSLLRVAGIDSVVIDPLPDRSDSILSTVEFVTRGSGNVLGPVLGRITRDSTFTLTSTWLVLGRRPPRDSVVQHKELQASVLRNVGRDCAQADPKLRVIEGARL